MSYKLTPAEEDFVEQVKKSITNEIMSQLDDLINLQNNTDKVYSLIKNLTATLYCFKWEPKWIAFRLNLKEIIINEVLTRLKSEYNVDSLSKLKNVFLKKNKHEDWFKTYKTIAKKKRRKVKNDYACYELARKYAK